MREREEGVREKERPHRGRKLPRSAENDQRHVTSQAIDWTEEEAMEIEGSHHPTHINSALPDVAGEPSEPPRLQRCLPAWTLRRRHNLAEAPVKPFPDEELDFFFKSH